MNLSDLCPEGLEKYAQYEVWRKYREWDPTIQTLYPERNTILAYQAYQEHVRDCELCKEE